MAKTEREEFIFQSRCQQAEITTASQGTARSI